MKPKEQKREEAKARAAARAKMTPAQQLAKLDREGHAAQKERARLAKEVG